WTASAPASPRRCSRPWHPTCRHCCRRNDNDIRPTRGRDVGPRANCSLHAASPAGHVSMKLIHLSDTHIVPAGNTLYGLDPCARFAPAVDDINATHADAALCIVTGDLAHWGEPDAYDTFAGIAARLKPRTILLIGNHDDRTAFHARFPDGLRDPNGFVQGAPFTEVATLVFLDTHDGTPHAGRYCAARQAWLKETLSSIAGDIVLFLHHPPFEVGIASMDAICLAERAELAGILR